MSAETTTQRVPLIYPFMLIICAIVATLFCYLYLTTSPNDSSANDLSAAGLSANHSSHKAEIHSQPQLQMGDSASTQNTPVVTSPTKEDTLIPQPPTESTATEQNRPFQLPSDSSLPGEIKVKTSPLATMPLAKSPALGDSVSYEQTNYSIQHVLDAQYGDTSQERITIQVPVLYQTRGMRWGPSEIQEASRILRAMEIYKGRVTQLKNDGHNIQKAWENLLARSQPLSALRADSPSLPSNTKLNETLSNTSESISPRHE